MPWFADVGMNLLDVQQFPLALKVDRVRRAAHFEVQEQPGELHKVVLA